MMAQLRMALLAFFLCLAQTATAAEVTVFAAASATNALNEIGEVFKAKTGHTLRPSYAASSVLAKQIEQGAPAEIFMSADQQWMDYLHQRALIDGQSRMNLLGNVMVLIAPSDSKITKIDLTQTPSLLPYLGDGRLAVGDPDHVPVGMYSKQAFTKLGQWQALEPKLARAESVRAALALVERGEAPLGIVYATDAKVSKKVIVVGTIPESLHDAILYPLALVSPTPSPQAKAFYDFLSQPDAKGLFAKYGFKLN